MSLHADAMSVLSGWSPPNHDQASVREAFLGLLLARQDACSRGCTPGHLTASAVVLDATLTRTLLTLHPRVGRWLQLGGHLEADPTVAAAALREATEESGIDGLRLDPVPLDLSVHPITCKGSPPTRHFDVRYLAVAPPGAVELRSEESEKLRWFGVHDLPDVSDELHALLRRAVERADGPVVPG